MKPNQKPFIIGITGGSASGKTLFLNQLLKSFSEEEICLISQDNYYRDRNDQEVDAHGYINFDVPNSLDLHQYAIDVRTIHEGKSFQKLELRFFVYLSIYLSIHLSIYISIHLSIYFFTYSFIYLFIYLIM